MKEIAISSTLPTINGNFEEIKAELTEQLKQFDLIVDIDSVKTAKAMATQINKLSGEIDKKRKQITEELSAPIKEFEAMMKELKDLCQESRQNLLSQVKMYDDKRLDEVRFLLSQELQNKYAHYGVRKEFQSAKIDDLVILSHLTQGGALVKKARDAIDERVSKNKKLQEKIDTRLLTLEAICFKGGLDAPLTRQNIESFLYENDDDVYLEKLTSLIANEVNRLREMEARKQEYKQRVTTTQSVIQNHPTPQQKPQPQKRKTVTQRFMKNVEEFASKKKKLVVTATFEMEVRFDMDEAALEKFMLNKFEDSVSKNIFKKVPKVHVEKFIPSMG